MKKRVIMCLCALTLVVLLGLVLINPIFNNNKVNGASFEPIPNGSGELLYGVLSSNEINFYGNNVNRYIFYKYPTGYNFDYSYVAYGNMNTESSGVIYLGTSYVGYVSSWLNIYTTIINQIATHSTIGTSQSSYPVIYRYDYSSTNGIPTTFTLKSERVHVFNDSGTYYVTEFVETSYNLGESYSKRIFNVNNKCSELSYSYSSYLSASDYYNQGYNQAVQDNEYLLGEYYQKGISETTTFYNDYILTNYVDKDSYNNIQNQLSWYINQYTILNNSDVNLTFGSFLKNIIDYPVTFVKKVFSYERTTVVNGVETTVYEPIEVLGIEVGSLCLGFFAICLTFSIIGIIRKFIR